MEILALKWNNHQAVFSNQISELRRKTIYTDATIACHGKFYQVHRLVLSTCSEYFSAIFNQTPCKNPVIVLKDINCRDLEFLLDYMYAGEVNVRQNELSSLIGAAENLQIKGLAISDEEINPLDEHKIKTKEKLDFLERSKYESSKVLDEDNSGVNYKSGKGFSKKKDFSSFTFNSSLNEEVDEVMNNDSSTLLPKDTQNLYLSDVKTEPELTSSSYDSNIKENPCSSNVEEGTCEEERTPPDYNFFSNEGDFSNDDGDIRTSFKDKSLKSLASLDQSTSLFSSTLQQAKDSFQPLGLTPSFLQGTTASQLSLDPHDSLPQGTYLQLPLSGVIGRGPRLIDRDSDKGSVKKDYACSYCGRTFSHRTNQLAHERIHTGEKPFRCLYCPFRTALKGNLKNHIFSRHHADWKSIKHLIFPSVES